jgi:zinc transporter ZupT
MAVFQLQAITAITAFIGGYLLFIPAVESLIFKFEHLSSCFIAGGFFYQGLNTIMGEIKENHEIKSLKDIGIIGLEFLALAAGFLIIELV